MAFLRFVCLLCGKSASQAFIDLSWIILDHPTPAKVGHSYELILTTRGGLCRYRIGDAVRITGKVGEMPLVELQGRAGKCFKLCDWATMDLGPWTLSLPHQNLNQVLPIPV